MKIPSLLLVLLTVVAVADGAVESQPNILVILADDFDWGDVSCYGGKVPTPALEVGPPAR